MFYVKRFIGAKSTAVMVGIALMSGCGGSSDNVNPLLELLDLPVVVPDADPIVTPVEPVVVQSDPVIATGLISGVTSGISVAQYYAGTPPQSVGTLILDPLNDGSEVVIIAGGSSELSVSSILPFTDVYVLSDSNGYFQLSLPQAVLATSVIVSYTADNLSAGQRQLDVIVGDATGNVSSNQTLALQSVEVGTGEVQVSVSWDKPTDVDLWLIEPDGEKIYYGNTNSDNGGSLDLDSNAGCSIDNVNNENITYEGVTAPMGEYIVIVDYYLDCSASAPTNYTVTVRADGLTTTYSGQLAVIDQNVEVTRFQVR